jgi:hypothetical protein
LISFLLKLLLVWTQAQPSQLPNQGTGTNLNIHQAAALCQSQQLNVFVFRISQSNPQQWDSGYINPWEVFAQPAYTAWKTPGSPIVDLIVNSPCNFLMVP